MLYHFMVMYVIMRHNLYFHLCCIIVYTILGNYMRELISTILAYLKGLGGCIALPVGFPGLFIFVGTQARGCYSTVAQAVAGACVICYTQARAMRHSLYTHNMLCMRELGRGAPSPQSADVGWALVGRTPLPTSKFSQILIYPLVLRNFLPNPK